MRRHLQLLALGLLLLHLHLQLQAAESADTSEDPSSSENGAQPAAFSPEQLARAREQLARLYDDSLDTDGDGKLTRAELAAWLGRAAAARADADVADSWGAFNLTGDAAATLDWDTYASRRMGGNAAEEASRAAREAGVRRAIQEASEEAGLAKAGLKVSLPEVPTAAPKEDAAALVELASDRRRWEAADADGDGRLSRREFRDFALAESSSPAVRRVLALEALERMDTDGDGRVSEAEFLGVATEAADNADKTGVATEEAKNFREVWDVSRDGYLDTEEVGKMLDYLDSPGAFEKEEAELHDAEAKQLLAVADTDGDGSLSKAEALAGVEAFAASPATDYGNSVGIHDEL